MPEGEVGGQEGGRGRGGVPQPELELEFEKRGRSDGHVAPKIPV